jgi:hypothetical protein
MGNVNDDEVSGFRGALISDKAHGVESTINWGAKLTN